MPKVCICFYGFVHRSLKYTFKSIEYHIFNVLKKNNIDYDVYLHTYDAKFSNAERCGENNVPIDINYYKLLNPLDYIIESYDDFNNKFDFEQYTKRYEDPWKNNYTSFINWVREMHSHLKVTTLWEDKADLYDLVLYLRADLMYITPLPINYLLNMLESNAFSYENFDWTKYVKRYTDLHHIPDKEHAWHHWTTSGKNEGRILFEHKDKLFTVPWGTHGGLNDLIAIGDKFAMIKWAKRLGHLHSYMEQIGGNSEQFLKYILNKLNLHNIDLPMLFYRTRACGKKNYEAWQDPDYIDLKNQCIKYGGRTIDDFEIIEI